MANELADLANRIDQLVSEARTAADKQRRTQSIEKALALACQLITKLNRRLERLVEQVLADCGLGEEHAALPFRDVVLADDALAELQSKEAVLDFLAACEPMLVSQLFLAKNKIKTILNEVAQTYEEFMDQRVSVKELRSQFGRLENFFCRPPYDGGGPILDGGGPSDGPSKGRGEKVCTYLQTFAAIGGLLAQVIGIIFGVQAHAPEAPRSQAREAETKVALLSLLALSGFYRKLNAQEAIPEEPYVLDVETPAVAGGASGRMTAGRGTAR